MTARRLLWAAAAAYAAGFTALSILRDRAFETARFDLGNMVQAVWTTAHGHPLEITSLQGDQISRLGAHVDPILAVFAPLWWLWPSPDLLLAGQAAAVALGALPVFWLAEKHLGSERAALGFALVYLLLPAVEWLTLNEFHPVALATPLLLYAFWYLDEDRLVPFALTAVAASLCKEEIALVVAGYGVWYALARRRRRAGLAIAGAGLAWSAFAVEVVLRHFNHGAASSFYSRYRDVGGSPGGILRTAATHPWDLATTAGDALAVPAAPGAPARRALPPLPARPRRRGARPRAQPALGNLDAAVDPLPLHGRADRAARRRERARRGEAAPPRHRGDGRRRRRAREQLRPRRGTAVALLPGRRDLRRLHDEGHPARPDRRARGEADPCRARW